MANVVRERKNGNAAYFVRNMHLNPTNVCTVDCKFCGFYRPYKTKEQGWTWDLDRALGEVRSNLHDAITEVHIVGGHNPDYPYAFYLDLVRGIHELPPCTSRRSPAPNTTSSRSFKKDLDTVIDDFRPRA
jgi:aminodeoxyfutalosine synthase